jgi:hypothetical protein
MTMLWQLPAPPFVGVPPNMLTRKSRCGAYRIVDNLVLARAAQGGSEQLIVAAHGGKPL